MKNGTLYFSHKDRIGLLALGILLIWIIYYHKHTSSEHVLQPEIIQSHINTTHKNYEKDKAKIKSFKHKDNKYKKSQTRQHSFVPSPVDPNTAEAKTLEAIGMSKFAINNLQKFLRKGGTIKSISDLDKIYGMPKGWTSEHEALFTFPSLNSNIQTTKIQLQDQNINKHIDINTADQAEFESLPCIGSTLAKRIIKYRNLLGGFYNIHQLKECYGVTDSSFNVIRSHIYVHGGIEKKSLRLLSESELAAHPYIGYKHAKHISRFLQQHQDAYEITTLYQVYSLDSNIVHNLSQYFKLE